MAHLPICVSIWVDGAHINPEQQGFEVNLGSDIFIRVSNWLPNTAIKVGVFVDDHQCNRYKKSIPEDIEHIVTYTAPCKIRVNVKCYPINDEAIDSNLINEFEWVFNVTTRQIRRTVSPVI